MRRTLLPLLILLTLLALMPGGCTPASVSGDHFALDTIISITLYDTQDAAILQQCWDRIDELEDTLSRTRVQSDIYRINHAQGKPVTVRPETAELLSTALEICKESQGALDITIGPVTELWNFKSSDPQLPDAGVLEEAVGRVGYDRVVLSGDTVTLPQGMALDLGAIAKGYIADELTTTLQQAGCKSALLNLGGNVLTLGEKPDHSPWVIGIRDPEGSASQSLLNLELNGSKAVVTSGIYERGFTLQGRRYHHLIDPGTGWPADNGLASVTIVAASSTLADGLSTACFVLGVDDGLSLLARYEDVEGLFIMQDGSCHTTDGFASLLQSPDPK